LRAFVRQAAGKNCGRIVEELWKNCRKILRALLWKIFLQFFHNSSTIFPCVEEFGASGLAWKRIVEGMIVEKLWKHLVNSAPGLRKFVTRYVISQNNYYKKTRNVEQQNLII
jgi:hypothetical protein